MGKTCTAFNKWWDDPEHSLAHDCPSDKWIAEKAWNAALEAAAVKSEPFQFENACDRVVAREISAAIRGMQG